MGPEAFLLVFEQVFTHTSVAYKQALADQLTPYYNDVLSELNCMIEPCDNHTEKIAALEAAIAEMAPFLSGGGGGGGGS